MNKETTNANLEGESAGAFSFAGSTEFGSEQTRDPFSEGAGTRAGRGSELFADIGTDPGSPNAGDSGATTRKRGRPKGSTNAKSGTTKLSAERLAGARAKLRDTISGVVGFGVSYYGTLRANKYKKVSPFLAQKVYYCYQIPKEAAVSVGEPLADTFITWFPDYVETTTKAIDPGLALARLFIILQQTHQNEMNEVRKYMLDPSSPVPNKPTTNGTSPHTEPDTTNLEEITNQWSQESPTPEEIHPNYQEPIPEQIHPDYSEIPSSG
jgi:hypothetical protein